jgi:hypothetical protein
MDSIRDIKNVIEYISTLHALTYNNYEYNHWVSIFFLAST